MNPHARGGPLPPHAEPFADTIAAIEAEMDALWGPNRPGKGWRGDPPEPFKAGSLPLAGFRRLKWLLKRHSLLMRGLDWEVEIVTADTRAPFRCVAIPIEPKTDAAADDPRNPSPPAWRPPAATVLAFELQIPIERVELALSRLPDAFKSDDGVRAFCAMVSDSIAVAVANGAKPRAPESAPPTAL
jgi:hypothetical protein